MDLIMTDRSCLLALTGAQVMLMSVCVARAGTNKLNCQFDLPTGAHLTKLHQSGKF